MKRYRFRLETVLRVRQLQADAAKGGVARANAEVIRRDRQLAERTEEYGPFGVVPAAAPTDLFLIEAAHRNRRAEAVMDANRELQSAHGVLAERRDEWQAAERRVDALERLDDRRRAEHGVASNRAEATEMDDVVVGRFGGRR